MRITADAKEATRRRILEAAAELFRSRGFDATTTRDIALAADIATGTLFNYFATKETIVEALVSQTLVKARATAECRQAGDVELEEALFAVVAGELRQLKPLRKFILPLLETSLSPLSAEPLTAARDSLRNEHLEVVAGMVRRHGLGELSPLALHVYWTLYVGVLGFWAGDKSPRQEDTLALLDQSLAMFVAWVRSGSGKATSPES
jgi:AcrR family transcriptional regulator